MLYYLIQSCLAHISMSFPPSRYNQLSKYYSDSGLVNYNLRSPLTVPPDYFSFPCKGFPKGPSVAIFDSNTITVTLEGTATHGGGHCQLGVSYDDNTFVVLRTVLNNCLLDSMTYSFDLPENISNQNLTVFWTWINRIGNREYYMECSDVTVNNYGTNTYIQGKELLVVNIGNNPRIPEWEIGAPSSIDGRDLLAQRNDITISKQKDNTNTINNNKRFQRKYKDQQKQPKNQEKEQSNYKETTKEKDQHKENQSNYQEKDKNISNNCILGDMRCNGVGFDTCVYNKWVYRDCAPGTNCQENANSILCV